MDIHKKITITLSADDVKEIIAKYLTESGYNVEPKDVMFHVCNETKGYGRGEYTVPCFQNCTAVVKGD